jgi:L-threonylcarbamoyladenylate synthase
VILRPGAISAGALAAVLGHPVTHAVGGPVKAPGQLPSHYAPRAGVVQVAPDGAAVAIAGLVSAGQRVAWVGSGEGADVALPRDDAGYARGLYAALREADRPDVDVIVIEAPPSGDLGLAIVDRLDRAAAPRPDEAG